MYGVPIVTGNHYENFRDIVNFFISRKRCEWWGWRSCRWFLWS